MTEEEAKQKWCPMVRAGTTAGQGSFNRHPEEISKAIGACIGSDCMMWRFNFDYSRGQAKPPGVGYCGLAGKP